MAGSPVPVDVDMRLTGSEWIVPLALGHSDS